MTHFDIKTHTRVYENEVLHQELKQKADQQRDGHWVGGLA